MKSKLILVGGTILATAFVVFAVAWNQYPIVLRPQPADTFLIGTTTTNQQIASSNVLAWTETNAVRRIAGSNYLFSSTAAITYDPVNSARNATNNYPWGSLYDVAGAAQNSTNRLVSTNDLRAVNLPNGSNVFKASVVSSETFNLITPPISGGATGAVWQSTVNGTAVLKSGSFTLDFQLGNNLEYSAGGSPNEFTWHGAFNGNGALVTNIPSTNIVYDLKNIQATNYTLLPTDVIIQGRGTNQVVTLLNSTTAPLARFYTFCLTSTNAAQSMLITNATGAQTILSAAALSQTITNGQSLTIFSDGVNWR